MASTKVQRTRLKRGSRDVFSAEKRSEVMSLIRAKNTKPEIAVRQILHSLGYRFRLHVPTLPGRPDIVLPKHSTIIDVRGCFWHGHRCLKGRIPYGNRTYWAPKLRANQLRDRQRARQLRKMGWRVCTVWECDIRRWTHVELACRLRKLLASD